jgi:hypothetical protein
MAPASYEADTQVTRSAKIVPSMTELLTPEHPDYEAARKVHNGLIDRRPALIARCHSTADVADAVRLARQRQLDICVRGGGHSVAGRAVVDNALMIDLAPMKQIGRAWGSGDVSSRSSWYVLSWIRVGKWVKREGCQAFPLERKPDCNPLTLYHAFLYANGATPPTIFFTMLVGLSG